MPVVTPGRRPAYPPIGRLRSSPLSGGKKSGFASLNLTAMVDMFTILVIFLIQLFTSDQVSLSDKIKVPTVVSGAPLQDPGTVIMMDNNGLLLIDNQPIPQSDMGDELADAAGAPIPGLVTILTARREFVEKTEGDRDATQSYKGLLIVQADIKTDFRLVRRVIGSANEAGWAKFKFVATPGTIDPAGDDIAPAEEGAAPAAEGG